ncbi:MAG: hypothetical protein ACK417_01100 [Bacteroidia bacterium]
MKIAGQEFPKWARISLFVTGSFMVLWLMVLIIGSPKSFGWAYRLEVNSWLLFFTSFGVLVNVFTLIFLGLTFFNQQKHHDEMMVESAFFAMLNSYSNLASNIFAAQEINVFARDLRYLYRDAHDLAFSNSERAPAWKEKVTISLRHGRSFFVDFFRLLRGGAFVYKQRLNPGISHNELFIKLFENPTNKNAYWPVCETIFLNFLAILEYLHVHQSRKRVLFESILNANISMEEMAIIYYLGHGKYNAGLTDQQRHVLKAFFDRYPINLRVPRDIQLSEVPLEWGSYRPS